MFSRRYVENYLKRVTGRSQTSKKEPIQYRTSEEGFACSEIRIRLPGRAVQHKNSTVRIRLQDSPVKKTYTADRQNTTGEEIQEPDYGTEKITSLVYVV
jgi:hypothetical protein